MVILSHGNEQQFLVTIDNRQNDCQKRISSGNRSNYGKTGYKFGQIFDETKTTFR